jgi:predicted NBD/HSP70 family sugar kinase
LKPALDSFIGGNSKLVRSINRAVILNLIREKQPISRIKISRLTKLNKSTVSSIVADLLDEDLIYQEVEPTPFVGRNPINLCLKLGVHFVGAINFDYTPSRVAIVDLDGTVRETVAIETSLDDAEGFVTRCVVELFKLKERLNIDHLEGVGVSVAGIVDPVKKEVVFAPRLGWEDFKLGALMEKLCPPEYFIIIDNDARASALAELWFGNHDLNLSNFVFLSVGPGIGTGIVVGKNLIYGDSSACGEFGHMTLFESNELCSCGNCGCWEAYASDRSTIKRFAEKTGSASPDGIVLQDIIDHAMKAKDSMACETLVETGHYLGLGIANVIKALDPEAIVIGGRITGAWDVVYPEIARTLLSKRAFFGKKKLCEFYQRHCQFGHDSWVRQLWQLRRSSVIFGSPDKFYLQKCSPICQSLLWLELVGLNNKLLLKMFCEFQMLVIMISLLTAKKYEKIGHVWH